MEELHKLIKFWMITEIAASGRMKHSSKKEALFRSTVFIKNWPIVRKYSKRLSSTVLQLTSHWKKKDFYLSRKKFTNKSSVSRDPNMGESCSIIDKSCWFGFNLYWSVLSFVRDPTSPPKALKIKASLVLGFIARAFSLVVIAAIAIVGALIEAALRISIFTGVKVLAISLIQKMKLSHECFYSPQVDSKSHRFIDPYRALSRILEIVTDFLNSFEKRRSLLC